MRRIWLGQRGERALFSGTDCLPAATLFDRINPLVTVAGSFLPAGADR
jgi:hypothetical protein